MLAPRKEDLISKPRTHLSLFLAGHVIGLGLKYVALCCEVVQKIPRGDKMFRRLNQTKPHLTIFFGVFSSLHIYIYTFILGY